MRHPNPPPRSPRPPSPETFRIFQFEVGFPAVPKGIHWKEQWLKSMNSMQLMKKKHHPYSIFSRYFEFYFILLCSTSNVRWAKMYVYFAYAHKASWHSVQYSPYPSRPIQVYQVRTNSFQTHSSLSGKNRFIPDPFKSIR